jgi:hypothetical protein
MYSTNGCFADVHATASLPLEPVGRRWEGTAGAFKTVALASGYGPGGVPATEPLDIPLQPARCPPSDSYEARLNPGDERAATFVWHADYVGGVAVIPQAVAIRATVGYDRQNGPPSYPPDYTGIRGNWFPIFKQLQAETSVDVAGAGPKPISAGEAVDAALGDASFRNFVDEQADGSCEGVNLYLNDIRGSAIFPDGPAWMVEVFCETGVPRHFAIAAIDPLTAAVRMVSVCNSPCQR